MSTLLDEPPPALFPASDFAAEWLVRLRNLQRLRLDFTAAPDFFRWTIQVRILSFLLSKHGEDPDLAPPALALGPETEPWIRLLPGAGVAPRAGEAFRPALGRIAQGNEDTRSRREIEEQCQARVEAAALLKSLREERRRAKEIGSVEVLARCMRMYRNKRRIAEGLRPFVWPRVARGFEGVVAAADSLAMKLGPESIAGILRRRLACRREDAENLALRIRAGEALAIATKPDVAARLADELEIAGVPSYPIHSCFDNAHAMSTREAFVVNSESSDFDALRHIVLAAIISVLVPCAGASLRIEHLSNGMVFCLGALLVGSLCMAAFLLMLAGARLRKEPTGLIAPWALFACIILLEFVGTIWCLFQLPTAS